MSLVNPELVRVQHDSLVAESQRYGEQRRAARARRLSRKAERAAQAARLALARAL